MALLYRIKQIIKPNNLFNNFKRNYFQIHNNTPRFITNITSSITISDYYSTNQAAVIQFREHFSFFNSRVRFFAAPVQVVKKKEPVKELKRSRLNAEITFEEIRLVTDEGHSIVSTREAMQRAKELKLDLVEVDRQAKPPVCRIMDYHREKYQKKMKQKELAKIKSATKMKRGPCKEVRFSPKAELKDLMTKIDTAKRLMERGYRVKCMALANSEELDLTGLLSQIAKLIEDVAIVEFGPKIEKRQGYLMVRHVKFGPPKKGSKAFMDNSATGTKIHTESGLCGGDSEEKQTAEESSIDSDDEESELDTDDEVEVSSQRQEGTSWSASSVPSANQNRYSRPAPTFSPSQTPNLAPNTPPNLSPSQGLQNRYAKKVPNNASAGRNPTGFPNGSQPPPRSHYPPGGSRQARDDGPPLRNFPPRQNEDRHPRAETPSQARQPNTNFSPHAGPPGRPNFSGNRASQSPGYGNFSGPKGNPSENFGPGGEANQQFSGRQAYVPRNGAGPGNMNSSVPRNSAVPGNMNSTTPTSRGTTGGDGKKWGIFSGDKSNPVPEKKS